MALALAVGFSSWGEGQRRWVCVSSGLRLGRGQARDLALRHNRSHAMGVACALVGQGFGRVGTDVVSQNVAGGALTFIVVVVVVAWVARGHAMVLVALRHSGRRHPPHGS